jgi:uncharacterized membrane protein YphA (DoxX/SURF4 family)
MDFRSWLFHPVVHLLLRIVLGGLFIVSGTLKLLAPRAEFIAIVHQYEILPESLGILYGTLLPWVEVLVGLFLVVGLYLRWSLAVTGLLLASFIIAIIVNLIRGRTIADCGCFGNAQFLGSSLEEILWRDIVLVAMGVWLAMTPPAWTLDPRKTDAAETPRP